MIIQSTKVWIAGTFKPAQIVINNSKIEKILSYNQERPDIDYQDLKIVPGFIEVHAHGAYNFDTNDAVSEGLKKWAKKLPEEGVTSFLATTVTQSEEVLTKALENVAQVANEDHEGAKIIGVHFEGPYLNLKYKGAQPEEHIVKGTIEQFERYQKAAKGLIKYITLAVENDEDYVLTRYLSQNGVVVSIGHSAATYEQALDGIANGANSFTHAFNGMSPLNQREPGCVGAILRTDTYSEIICDGNHVKPDVIHAVFMAKGKDRMMCVTDSLMAKGNEVGSKGLLGGHEFYIDEKGSARLVSTNGLAGSTLRANEGLKILVEEALLPFEYAINALTKNPAECLGLKNVGKLVAGYDADIVVLDRDYQIVQTYCKGKKQL